MDKREPCRLIAISGLKGGIGRTTCALALARALASLAHRVLLVDMSVYGTGFKQNVEFSQFTDVLSDVPAPTVVEQIDAMCLPSGQVIPEKLCSVWRSLGYDDVILDLRPVPDDVNCDFFLLSDLPIFLISAEPEAVVLGTVWLRLLLVRYFKKCMPAPELLEVFSKSPDSFQFKDMYLSLSCEKQAQFLHALCQFRSAMLLNMKREQSEELQGMALCHALDMMFGVHVKFLGAVSFDDRRWFYARRLGDVSIFSREDLAVREFVGMARNFGEMSENFSQESDCLPLISVSARPRAFLQATSAAQARMVYRQLWEGYRRANGMIEWVMPTDQIAYVIGLLEQAWRMAEYEPGAEKMSENLTNSGRMERHSGMLPKITRAFSSTFAAANHTRAKCDPEAGRWIQEMRARKNLSIAQLAIKSRIPQRTLERIENLDVDSISMTRLQAYLYEIARVLDIQFDELRCRFGL